MALRPSGELRALHHDDALARMQGLGVIVQHLLDQGGDQSHELLVERVAEHGMRDDARALEEGGWPDALGAVDDLVGDDEVPGTDLLAKGADGAEGDDGLDAERFEGGDVGLGGY